MRQARLTDDDANRKGFIERLKQVVGAGSARAFAKLAGIPPTTFAKCLNGLTEPTRPTLVAIAKAADVRLDWLLLGEGPMKRAELPESRGLTVYEGGKTDEEPVDFELLQDCLEVLDEVLEEKHRRLTHEKKAQAAILLYQMYQAEEDEEKKIDRSTVLRLVDLTGS